MDSLSLDILGYLTEFLNNHDKCRFMMTCKNMSNCEFFFRELTVTDKIINSQWFNRFTNIFIKKQIGILPSSVTHLSFDVHFNALIKDQIPTSVKYLAFSDDYDYLVRGYFKGELSYQEYDGREPFFKNHIPSSVTNLRLGPFFEYDISNIIPSSVTHLTLCSYVNMPLKDLIH